MAKYYVTDGSFDIGPYDNRRDATIALCAATLDSLTKGAAEARFRVEEREERPKPVDAAEITDFDKACAFLGFKGENKICLDLLDGQAETVEAFLMLDTFCQAWNKADGFVPDWTDNGQRKFYPLYRRGADSISADSYSNGIQCSPFLFKTRERATQFGEQFIGLFRQLYGIKDNE